MGILSNGGSHTINGGSGKKSLSKNKYKYICAGKKDTYVWFGQFCVYFAYGQLS